MPIKKPGIKKPGNIDHCIKAITKGLRHNKIIPYSDLKRHADAHNVSPQEIEQELREKHGYAISRQIPNQEILSAEIAKRIIADHSEPEVRKNAAEKYLKMRQRYQK